MSKHLKRFLNLFLPVFLSVLFQIFSPSIATATSDCINSVQIPATWKTRFPFDLVYPVNALNTSIDTECPTVNLWGVDREMCAPSMIAKIAKNAFLLKVVVQSILHL